MADLFTRLAQRGTRTGTVAPRPTSRFEPGAGHRPPSPTGPDEDAAADPSRASLPSMPAPPAPPPEPGVAGPGVRPHPGRTVSHVDIAGTPTPARIHSSGHASGVGAATPRELARHEPAPRELARRDRTPGDLATAASPSAPGRPAPDADAAAAPPPSAAVLRPGRGEQATDGPQRLRPTVSGHVDATGRSTVATSGRSPASTARRAADDAAPTVHISIGRIEVRATTPAPPRSEPTPAPASGFSLAAYLRGDDGRPR